MTLLRIGLFLLLSLTLPVNGMAQLLTSAQPCPMHQAQAPAPAQAGHDAHAGMLSGMHHGAQPEAHPHCDHAQQGMNAKLCKSGLDCKTSSLFQVAIGKTPTLTSARPGPLPLSFTPLPGQSEPHWHPPRA